MKPRCQGRAGYAGANDDVVEAVGAGPVGAQRAVVGGGVRHLTLTRGFDFVSFERGGLDSILAYWAV